MSKLSVGKIGEDAAAQFLKKKGMRILKRNYRTPFGEIDIIARKRSVLHFVEVKTRRNEKYGKPFEAVNERKLAHIRKSAEYYLQKECAENENFDFEIDIVSILMKGEKKEIEFIENVF